MTQETKVTMMTVRELAKTGILTEHAIRLNNPAPNRNIHDFESED